MVEINRDTYIEIGRTLRRIVTEKSSPNYKWEELVQRMCASSNSALHDIGIKELNELNNKH